MGGKHKIFSLVIKLSEMPADPYTAKTMLISVIPKLSTFTINHPKKHGS
jgi:hypothetical protein